MMEGLRFSKPCLPHAALQHSSHSSESIQKDWTAPANLHPLPLAEIGEEFLFQVIAERAERARLIAGGVSFGFVLDLSSIDGERIPLQDVTIE